jgi:AGCS family alanine or glycine:cation symporter
MLDFSDLLFFAMALPNLIGLYVLQGDVKANLDVYLSKWRDGELDREAIR